MVFKSGVRDELLASTWLSSLKQIHDFGRVDQTPDATLLVDIKRALIESDCPQETANALTKNSNKEQWMPQIRELVLNEDAYHFLTVERWRYWRPFCRFISKRIPNTQAVVVMAADNQHMPSDAVMEPGFMVVFEGGVVDRSDSRCPIL